MTQQEKTGNRPLEMSQWIRNNLPDSLTGTRVTDIDFVITNVNSNGVLFVEVKTRNTPMKNWQREIYLKVIDALGIAGLDSRLICITFENTFFHDGRVYLDGKLSNEDEIRQVLSDWC